MIRGIKRECWYVIRVDRVTDEAAGGMCVKPDHEEEGEVVSIPERFETLLADFVVCGGIHQEHDK